MQFQRNTLLEILIFQMHKLASFRKHLAGGYILQRMLIL